MEFSCAAVLFDLDGVLVDSRVVVERQWSLWAREHGLDPGHVIHVAHGRPTVDTVRAVAPAADAVAEAAKIEQREIADMDGVRAIEGAAALLAQLPRERWAVATSGTRALATARLQFAGLPLPRVLVPADEVLRGKPDPEPYVKAASLLGFAAEECLVIEDAPSGIRAAKAAGARVVALPTTYPASELTSADVIASSLSAIRLVAGNGAEPLRIQVPADSTL